MRTARFSKAKIGGDQDEAKDCGDDVVDEHRDMEVDRFFAVRVDLGRFVALYQPDDEWREQAPGEMRNAEWAFGMGTAQKCESKK